MIKVLVTAFEPFDQEPENSSALVLKNLESSPEVAKAILPVSFERAWPALESLLEKFKPLAVLALGQADQRTKISLEQVALNVMSARIDDADGKRPLDLPIYPQRELALPSRLPNQKLLKVLAAAGIEAELSYSAGTYVCNAVMYSLLVWSKKTGNPAGFVHLPLVRSQELKVGRDRPVPQLELAAAVRAIQILVDELRSMN